MAAGVLPKPGSKYGPCKKQSCGHLDCVEQRKMAVTKCVICDIPIGYEKRFYDERERGLVHAVCLEEEIEKARSKPD